MTSADKASGDADPSRAASPAILSFAGSRNSRIVGKASRTVRVGRGRVGRGGEEQQDEGSCDQRTCLLWAMLLRKEGEICYSGDYFSLSRCLC